MWGGRPHVGVEKHGEISDVMSSPGLSTMIRVDMCFQE